MSDQKTPAQNTDELKKKLAEAETAEKKKIAEEDAKEAVVQEAETEKLKKELNDMTELAKRTMADMQNLQRRTMEERGSIIFMANFDLIKDILPIVDNLSRAKANMPVEAEAWYKGIEMSIEQLNKVLAEAGVKKIETVGQKFDPNLHEALMQEKGEKDMILEELEAGYSLGNRILRHAKVKIGNGQHETSASE
jgi:molecular chaperone GrpE